MTGNRRDDRRGDARGGADDTPADEYAPALSARALEQVSELACRLLDASRAGVWFLEGDRSRLRRLHLYDGRRDRHGGAAGVLDRDRFPAYFTCLEETGGALVVWDAAHDLRVQELHDVHARPLGVRAWLDSPIPGPDGFRGILRVEQVGRTRHWTSDERRVLAALGELLVQPGAPITERAVKTVVAAGSGEVTRSELLERLPAGVALIDPSGSIAWCNSGLAQLLDYDDSEALEGRPIGSVQGSGDPRDRLTERLRSEGRVVSEGYEGRTSGGEPIWLLESAVRLEDTGFDAGGRAGEGYVLSAFMDATEMREREEELEERAYRDALTGLPNRRFLRMNLKQSLALAGRHGRRLAVGYLDLNGFKAVNDRHGHAVGDEVLRITARRLSEGIRDSDLVARIGGDEFVIVFAEVEGPEGAREVSRRLMHSFRAPIRVGENEIRVGADVGVALFPEHGDDVDTLLHRADQAMYRMKRLECNGICLYESEKAEAAASPPSDRTAGEAPAEKEPETEVPTSGGEAPDEATTEPEPRVADSGPEADDGPGRPAATREKEPPRETEDDRSEAPDDERGTDFPPRELERALVEDQLALHYQPVYRLSSGETVGAEALLRWEHPRAGLLPAGRFVPSAEAASLLGRFDRWALEGAARQLAHWGERAGSLFLSVNVAPGSLKGLTDFLEEVFGRTGLAPERLAVEVVIDPDTDDEAALAGRLTRLKALGCRTALDFSPGHPDTARFLKRVPADMVKLDMAYLAREPDAPGPGRLLAGIDPSEVELLVKRVETEAQYRIARRRVATMGQGYYWTRPLPARPASGD